MLILAAGTAVNGPDVRNVGTTKERDIQLSHNGTAFKIKFED